jgi:hypothetical protein
MNYPTFTIGIDYHFEPIELKQFKKEKLDPGKKIWKFNLEVLTSIKVQNKTDEFEEKACFAYGFSTFANKRLSKFSALNFGLEFVADYYVKEQIKRTGLTSDFKRAAGFIGHDLIFGQVNFTINIGAYFYSPFKAKDFLYQKYMLQYKFNKHLYAGIYMLAHGDAADLMGFNFGYTF